MRESRTIEPALGTAPQKRQQRQGELRQAAEMVQRMNRRSRKYWGWWTTVPLFLTLMSAQAAFGQSDQSFAKPLTLDQVLQYSLEHYPAVRAALEQVTAAQATIALARANYLPQFSGVYQDSRATQNQVPGIWLATPITPTVEGPISGASGQSYWGSQAAALFSFEPVDFGLRAAKVNQARAGEEKARADLSLTRLQVATEAGNYFLLAVANHEAVVAAEANVERWQVFNRSVHVLTDNELRPGVDASRADAELARAKTQLYETQEGERVALDTLAAFMGQAGATLQLDGSRLFETPGGALQATAVTAHPLVEEDAAAVREARAQEQVLGRTDYPRLYLQAEGFGRGSEIPDNGTIIGNANGLEPARGNWIAGVTVLFPDVFALKALSAEKKRAQAEERTQEARRDQAIQDLTAQMQAAREKWKTAQLVAQETPTELAAAKQSETQSRARYDAGLATLVEVADAENLLRQAQMDDALARLNLWRGLFGIAYAQGDFADFLKVLRAGGGGVH